MKRRDFLRSLTAGSLGLMLGNGLSIQRAFAAGPLDPYRKFVFVYFSGAWDVLLGLDPRDPDEFTEERVEDTGIQPAWHLVEAGNPGAYMGLVGGDDAPYRLGPAMDAMLPHYDVCSVVRGIAMDTVTHEVGRRYFITGMMPRGLSAAGSSMTWARQFSSPDAASTDTTPPRNVQQA